MEAIAIIDAVLLAITLGVFGVWIYFSIFVIKTLRYSPRLDSIRLKHMPRIDIILPARNEEEFIGRCLDSLLKQDYKNIRVIAVDDCSTDNTASIIKGYASKDPRIVYVYADKKPDGWTGKNWACYQGYLRSDADILLFTDADSNYSKHLISLALSKFVEHGLDALTLMPRIICLDVFTKMTLPLLNNVLYSRYSPLRVNDPNHKLGYFFGSFFIIRRKVYEDIGTHKSVRNELVEDGALGAKVKALGYKVMMFRAEEYFNAIWARDLNSLINGLARLVAPMNANAKKTAISLLLLSFFIFIYPFISLVYSSILYALASGIIEQILFYSSIALIITMIMMSMIQARNLRISIGYGFAIAIGAVIILSGFIHGMLGSKGKGVSWRGREYVYEFYKADGFQP